MITVLDNSLTRKKHTLNLVDHKGRVLGFNPYPGNKQIRYDLKNEEGKDLLEFNDMPIEKYLIGAPFHFGSDITFVPSQKDNSLTAINIDLISDKHGIVNYLTINGVGGEYYVDDIGLSDEELSSLFSSDKIRYWKEHSCWRPLYPYELKQEKTWEEMNDSERIAFLLKKIEKLEEKVNLLGNLK